MALSLDLSKGIIAADEQGQGAIRHLVKRCKVGEATG